MFLGNIGGGGGAGIVCRFKGAQKERGVAVFDGGWYPNARYDTLPKTNNSFLKNSNSCVYSVKDS